MRENRTCGSEGGEAQSLPYPYPHTRAPGTGGVARVRRLSSRQGSLGVTGSAPFPPGREAKGK